MTSRNPRTAIIIAAVLVALVAVGVGFYRLGRSTDQPPTTSPTVTPKGSPIPTYEPTDQYGSPEPALARGEAAAGAGGSTTGPAGMPLGYTHDQTGAVNAATNYLTWMNSIRIVDKPTADAMAAASAANPETEAALIYSFDQIRTGMANLTADEPQPARGAYAIATSDDDHALVYIWAPEVITDTGGQPEHVWAIDGVAVVWADGDWKLDGGLISTTGSAAVDPVDPTGNPTAEEKHSILSRTPADPGEITNSADQTWLEYQNAPR